MNLLYWYLSVQILIVVGYALSRVIASSGNHYARLQLHYGVLTTLAVAVVFQLCVPIRSDFTPIYKSMAAAVAQSPMIHPFSNLNLDTTPLYVSTHDYGTHVETLTYGVMAVLFLLGVILFKIFRDLRALERLRVGAYTLKRVGRVQVLASDRVSIPISFWTPRASVVVVPTVLLARPDEYRMSVWHELQHHRQRDPIWMLALETLNLFGWLNPFSRKWVLLITELQEFACDETLVDRNKVNSRQYASYLVEVAQSALQAKPVPACATGLWFRLGRHPLKRRVQMLLEKSVLHSIPAQSRSKFLIRSKLALVLVVLTGASYATKGIAQEQIDRHYTLEEAKALAANLHGTDGLPVAINAQVVAELDRYLGSAAKRQAARAALIRKRDIYQPVVDKMLAKYQFPQAMDAIPFIESYYQNKAESHIQGHGAGLWMFIVPTAKRFGMKVDEQRNVDERLNVEKETIAAGKYLKANELEFNDLGLSILAYNWGESQLRKLIAENQSRDPWALSRAFKNDNYLAQMMAAMLIIANPKITE